MVVQSSYPVRAFMIQDNERRPSLWWGRRLVYAYLDLLTVTHRYHYVFFLHFGNAIGNTTEALEAGIASSAEACDVVYEVEVRSSLNSLQVVSM